MADYECRLLDGKDRLVDVHAIRADSDHQACNAAEAHCATRGEARYEVWRAGKLIRRALTVPGGSVLPLS